MQSCIETKQTNDWFGLVWFMWLHGCTTACSRDGQAVGCKRHPLRAFARAGNFSQFPKQRCPQRMRGRTHWDSASTGGCYQCPMKGCAPPGKPGFALDAGVRTSARTRAHAPLELTVLPRRAGESPLLAGRQHHARQPVGLSRAAYWNRGQACWMRRATRGKQACTRAQRGGQSRATVGV